MPLPCDSSDVPAQIRQSLAQQRVHEHLFRMDEFANPVDNDSDDGAHVDIDADSNPEGEVPHIVSRRPTQPSPMAYPAV